MGAAISGDPTGQIFPWHPKPVSNLKRGPGNINEVPTVIAFCETCDAAAQRSAEEAMTPVAEKYLEGAKTKGEEDPEISFMIVTEKDGLGGRIRGMLSLPELTTVSMPPKLMIVDIPVSGGVYEGPEGAVTTEMLEKLVNDYTGKSLKRRR